MLAQAAIPLYMRDQKAHVLSSPGNAKESESNKCVDNVSAGKMMARNLRIVSFHSVPSNRVFALQDVVTHPRKLRIHT
jgi:hypothetical protein